MKYKEKKIEPSFVSEPDLDLDLDTEPDQDNFEIRPELEKYFDRLLQIGIEQADRGELIPIEEVLARYR